MARRWAVLASVFLVSFTGLAFEVSLTRIFSVVLNYHYVFVVVSGAVCGLGLGGFAWHLLSQRGPPRREVGWAALSFAVLMPTSIVLLFGSSALITAYLWTAITPLLPFIFAGAFLAEVFRERAQESGRFYQADLFGAGMAAVLIVPLIGLTGALDLVFLLGGVAAIGALCWAWSRKDRRLLVASAASIAFLLAAWPVSARRDYLQFRRLGGASPIVTKAMLRGQPEAGQVEALLDSDWSAYARTDLVRYDSPEAGLYTLQIYTDGDNPSQMAPFDGDLRALSQLRRELPFFGYDLSPHGELLSLGPGAGRDFLWGMLAGFTRMDGVEINASIARMMDRYHAINGDLYYRPGVRVTIEDGRSFIRRSRKQYDLINCTLTQTATTLSTGHALVESYIHTREAFADYFGHLTPDGRYMLVTQSEAMILRAALTAMAVMADQGIGPQEACRHLAALGRPPPGPAEPETPYRYLLIWKQSPLTPQDVGRLLRATQVAPAIPIFLPGVPGKGPLSRIASGEAAPEEVAAAGITEEGVQVNIRPATDDRPFFLDLSLGISSVLKWFLLISLGLAGGFSLALLRRERGPGSHPRWWALYFSALGLGFMLVEVPLIQRFILFLGHPTSSLAAILCYLLVGASVGSRLSQGWAAERLSRAIAAAGAVACIIAAGYRLALGPALGSLLPLPLVAKVAVMGVLILPLGIALGIPFPSGIRLMSRTAQEHVPWMWGVNGLMSVVGSTIAAAGAKVIGFNGCLLLAAAIYGSLVVIAPRLEPEQLSAQPTAASRRPRRGPRRGRL